jgi:HK97 family phage major capsid protein
MSSFTAVTLQMLEDSAFDLENELREDTIEGFGELEAAAIIAGDAHKKPEGILNADGTIQVNTGTAATITADALIGLKYSLKTPYARNGNFVLNRSTLGAIRILKDANGQYLWASGLAAGRANTIDGETYVEMPGIAERRCRSEAGDLR